MVPQLKLYGIEPGKVFIDNSINSVIKLRCADKANIRLFTMLGNEGLNNLEQCCQDVLENNVEGDFCEAGVWRGGSCIFMNHMLKKYASNKQTYLLDAFDAMDKFKNTEQNNINPKGAALDEISIECLTKIAQYYGNGYSLIKISQNEVKLNMDLFVSSANTVFIKGWIDKGFNFNKMKDVELSILRIDCDLYLPTKYLLENLYHKVVYNGYIILDEYFVNMLGEQCAVDEFRKKRNITTSILRCGPEKNARIGYWKKNKITG